MSSYAELLIRLGRRYAHSYTVEPQFSHPGTDADTEPDAGEATFDFDGLDELLDDVAAYGKLLTDNLFADPKVRTGFEQACAAADLLKVPPRVRLFVDPGAAELHALRWETLRDPRNDSSLVTGERILFSRYLRSPDWRSVHLGPQSELHALVVVANPANLGRFGPEGVPLQALDVADELARAQAALGAIPVTPLASGGQATLNRLGQHLREGYGVLYLVCHGALVRGQPWLWLEDDQGNAAVVAGSELAEELAKLRTPPTLVVLASCQSAGSGTTGALSAVGPRLARAGVPAVLAMQGKISVDTSGAFMRRFFEELALDGQIDRAVAVARGDVKDRPDAWMPVLFTRLKSGRIWSASGPAAGEQDFGKWPGLLTNIREGRCTPIIGPGLIDFLLGSPREVAQRWANTYRFPMAPHDREDLPQVAQYLAVKQSDPEFPRAKFGEYMGQEMWERYGNQLPDTLRDASLGELVREIGAQRRKRDEAEPYRVLASLPLPIYITTNPDNLLAEALIEAGRSPEVELCRWRDDVDVDWPPSVYDREPDYRPTVERPLVYHLFGQMRTRDSLVLTEDDYFDYLIGVTKNEEIIPKAVIRAWNDTALLFLGFQVGDWNFRVLFKSIMNQEGSGRRRKKAHVAVEIDPEEGRSLEPQGARRYLEAYFQADDINIYWGNAEQFVRQLWGHWKQTELERQRP